MAGVQALVRSGNFGEGDELIGLRISAGVVDEPGCQAPGTVLHALIDEVLHRPQLLGRRLAIGIAHDFLPDVIVRHLMDDIGADADLFELREIGRDIDGSRAAVAGDDGGDALHLVIEVGAGLLVLQRIIAVRVQIDEAGSDDEPLAIEDSRRAFDLELADGDDAIRLDRDIADLSRDPEPS